MLNLPSAYDVYTTLHYESDANVALFFDHYQTARNIYVYSHERHGYWKERLKQYNNVMVRPWELGGPITNLDLTELKNTCWHGSDATWVVVCDSDELLIIPNGESIKGAVRCIYPYDIVAEEPYTKLGDITQGVLIGGTQWRKTLAFKPVLFPDLSYTQGGHKVKPPIPESHVTPGIMVHLKYNGRERFLESRRHTSLSSANEGESKVHFDYMLSLPQQKIGI